MVQFRTIEAKKQTKKMGFKKKSSLSFVKLAAERTKSGGAPQKAASDDKRKLLYGEGLAYLNEVLSAIRNNQAFTLDKGLQIIRKLASGNPAQDPALSMALHLNDRFKFVLHHGVNVAVYALKLAKYLDFSQENQIEIGLTALLHDVGTAAIPDKIIYKQKKLNEQEIKIFRERPNYSYKILQQFGADYAYLAECAAQVHERIDGTGYPAGLKANEIHKYAQIIGLLDKYEALIHSRPQRDKLTPFTAVKEIINTGKDQFNRKYLKALLNTFTVFPLHSYVRLNSDAIGKVIETYPDQPMRPKIRIEYDSQNQKVLTDRVVALPEDSLLHIVDSVTDEEIAQLSAV
ncbi:MAG: HD domain-containing protein [Deltaproteobacteria bacterium]|nr:HD domain-containing protein [Deltaproteobacteria bacterium]